MIMPIKPATFPLTQLPAAPVVSSTPSVSAQGLSGAASASTGTSAINRPSVPGVPTAEGTTGEFSQKLREALGEANEAQVRAEAASQDYASGKQNDLHGTMITMTEADVSLRLVANVRNRVIEAYREVMRMGS